MADVTLKPGETVAVSGQYVQVDAAGMVQEDLAEGTLVEGDTAPPTAEEGWTWVLVDASKRKAEPHKAEATDEKSPRLPPTEVLKSSKRKQQSE